MPSFGVSYDNIKGNVYVDRYNAFYLFNLISNLFIYLFSDSGEDQSTPQVVALETNPSDNTQILIGYSNSVVALCDLSAQKLVKSYKTPPGVCCKYNYLFQF